jgi:hypothetical protein
LLLCTRRLDGVKCSWRCLCCLSLAPGGLRRGAYVGADRSDNSILAGVFAACMCDLVI